MDIIFTQINGWDDFDYDALFAASEASLETNYFAKVPLPLTYEEKKQYYREQMQLAFDGDYYLQKDKEKLFFFKGTFDGILMEFGGGYIEDDNETLRFHWYLTAPDASGSRNVLHLDTTAAIRKVFYNQHGITKYRVETYKGSPFQSWMRMRANSGHRVLLSETETELADGLIAVSMHMEV